MGRSEGLTFTRAEGRELHDPTGSDPGLPDVLVGFLARHQPGDVAAVAG